MLFIWKGNLFGRGIMIYLIVLLSISGLLIYGAWKDWHHARVSNKITFAAIALSILVFPMVDSQFFRVLFILIYYIMFNNLQIIGGADFKILIASLLSTPHLWLFLSTLIIYSLIIAVQMRITGRNKLFAKISNGTTKLLEERIPGFVPIAMAYIVTMALIATVGWFTL